MSYGSAREKVQLVVMLLALLYFGRMTWAGSALGAPAVTVAVLAIAQHLWRLRQRAAYRVPGSSEP